MHASSPTRLRILIYGLNFSPELTGIGKYTGDWVRHLAGQGHEIRVVAGPPYYPEWLIHPEYRRAFYRVERPPSPGGPTVYRTPLYVPLHPSGRARVAHLFSFAAFSIPQMLRQITWQPDIVITIEPTFCVAPIALVVATLAGCPSWLHIQDFEVDAAFDLNLLQAGGTVHRFALAGERFFTHRFTRVSSISRQMVDRVIAKGTDPARTLLFPNWVDTDAIYPQPPGHPNPLREKLSLNSKIIALYSGNMGNKQGVECLAPLADSFKDQPELHFIFCGEGAFRVRLEALVAGRTNVTMLPLQDERDLNVLLNAADIHLLPQRAGAADLVMPSKLTGMLASGRPVVATAHPGTQLARIIQGGESDGTDAELHACGLAVPPEDSQALHDAVQTLAQSHDLRAVLGAGGRRYAVEHMARKDILPRVGDELRAMTERPLPSSSKLGSTNLKIHPMEAKR